MDDEHLSNHTAAAPSADNAQRFIALKFAQSVSEKLKAAVDVRSIGLVEGSASAFDESMEEASCGFCILSGNGKAATPIKLEFLPAIAVAFIDRLLGGGGRAYVPRRALTRIERDILAGVADCAVTAINDALPQAGPFVRQPCVPHATSADENCPAWIARFSITLGCHAGAMRLCLPAAIVARPQAESRESAAISPVELSAIVEDATIDADDLANLQAGDIIVTESPVEGEVVVRLAGIPKFIGTLVCSNGKRAVRITRPIG